jgi:hypothetical protein
MKTTRYFWSYLAQFLEWEMCSDKKFWINSKHILCPITIFQNPYLLWNNVEKICRAGHATDDNWGILIACWILRLHMHSQNVTLIASSLQQWLQEHASILNYTYIACLVESLLLFLRLLHQGDTPNIFPYSDRSGKERDVLSLADQFKIFGS